MASYLLSIPCKKALGPDIDFHKPLKTFIENSYGKEQYEASKSAIDELQSLRSKVVIKLGDRHDSALEILLRYHDQLCAIETKMPIVENGVRIDFKWQDCFDKESLFGSKTSLKMSSGSFEKVCILFNIAAMQSQISEAQNLSDDDGLKKATVYLQLSAGIFEFLKHNVTSMIGREPTPDMNYDTCSALHSLMLAQAQDCIYKKAVREKKSNKIVAKVAMHAADLYADALRIMQLPSVKDILKDYIGYVASKQAGFHGLAEYHQSRVEADEKSYGKEIARLRHADELFKAANTRGGSQFVLKDDWSKVKRALEISEKDNNLIYHDNVPSTNQLVAVEKVALAKATPLRHPLSGEKFSDLFSKLVPISVHMAIMAFENRKAQLINAEIGRMREATNLMCGVMTSLNLPAALEDTAGTDVPAFLLEKSVKIRQDGGLAKLEMTMRELPEMLQRNKELLDESVRVLDDELESDTKLRNQYGERWARTPSEKLTDGLRGDAAKYGAIISNAMSADAVVRERYLAHRAGLELLSKDVAELRAGLPKDDSSLGYNGPVQERDKLRTLCDAVESIKTERQNLELQFQSVTFDSLVSDLSAALAGTTDFNEEKFSGDRLSNAFQLLREQLHKSLNRQEILLAELQKSTSLLVGSNGGGSASLRQQKMSELAAAYDAYVQLQNNLQEGMKFYGDLTQILIKFQNKVEDFCFARKTEKDELMADLNRSIVSQRNPSLATIPDFQATSSGTTSSSSQPPPRPENPPSVQPPPPTYSQNNSATVPQQQAANLPYPVAYHSGMTFPCIPPSIGSSGYGYVGQVPPNVVYGPNHYQAMPQQPPYQYPAYPIYPQQNMYPQQNTEWRGRY